MHQSPTSSFTLSPVLLDPREQGLCDRGEPRRRDDCPREDLSTAAERPLCLPRDEGKPRQQSD